MTSLFRNISRNAGPDWRRLLCGTLPAAALIFGLSSLTAEAAWSDLDRAELTALEQGILTRNEEDKNLKGETRLTRIEDHAADGRLIGSQICSYDTEGRLISVLDADQPNTGTVLEYDPTGLRNETTYDADGSYSRIHYDYNRYGQIVRWGYSNSNAPYEHDVYDTLEYDQKGQLWRIVDYAEYKGREQLRYDAHGNLTDVLLEDVSGTPYSENRYYYSAGNRLTQKSFISDLKNPGSSAIVLAGYGWSEDGLLEEIHYYPSPFNAEEHALLFFYN